MELAIMLACCGLLFELIDAARSFVARKKLQWDCEKAQFYKHGGDW